jgi:hypothetical protein
MLDNPPLHWTAAAERLISSMVFGAAAASERQSVMRRRWKHLLVLLSGPAATLVLIQLLPSLSRPLSRAEIWWSWVFVSLPSVTAMTIWIGTPTVQLANEQPWAYFAHYLFVVRL